MSQNPRASDTTVFASCHRHWHFGIDTLPACNLHRGLVQLRLHVAALPGAMPNIAQFDPYKVQNISVLTKKPNAKQALELLESIAKQVQPILRRRQDIAALIHACWRWLQLHELTSSRLMSGILALIAGNGRCHSYPSSYREATTCW